MKNAYVFVSAYDSKDHGVIILVEKTEEDAVNTLKKKVGINPDDYELILSLPLREDVNVTEFQVVFSHEDKRFIHRNITSIK